MSNYKKIVVGILLSFMLTNAFADFIFNKDDCDELPGEWHGRGTTKTYKLSDCLADVVITKNGDVDLYIYDIFSAQNKITKMRIASCRNGIFKLQTIKEEGESMVKTAPEIFGYLELDNKHMILGDEYNKLQLTKSS